jgi:hypothetical protein
VFGHGVGGWQPIRAQPSTWSSAPAHIELDTSGRASSEIEDPVIDAILILLVVAIQLVIGNGNVQIVGSIKATRHSN